MWSWTWTINRCHVGMSQLTRFSLRTSLSISPLGKSAGRNPSGPQGRCHSGSLRSIRNVQSKDDVRAHPVPVARNGEDPRSNRGQTTTERIALEVDTKRGFRARTHVRLALSNTLPQRSSRTSVGRWNFTSCSRKFTGRNLTDFLKLRDSRRRCSSKRDSQDSRSDRSRVRTAPGGDGG